jgi:anti-sigma factor RsiW
MTPADLEAYLDEALPTEEMTRIEIALRSDAQMAARLAEIVARRDSGLVSLGAIWRRHRLSCPTRQDLGSYLLGVLPEEAAKYLEFHLDVAGCRYCQANLSDLKDQQSEPHEATQDRRRKYFQSSAGRLRQG